MDPHHSIEKRESNLELNESNPDPASNIPNATPEVKLVAFAEPFIRNFKTRHRILQKITRLFEFQRFNRCW